MGRWQRLSSLFQHLVAVAVFVVVVVDVAAVAAAAAADALFLCGQQCGEVGVDFFSLGRFILHGHFVETNPIMAVILIHVKQ
jgi:cytochrome b561